MQKYLIFSILISAIFPLLTACRDNKDYALGDSPIRYVDVSFRAIGPLGLKQKAEAMDISLIRGFIGQFPVNVSMLLSRDEGTATWSSKALIHGRYVLDMRLPVKDDGEGKMVQALGDITFMILEVSEVSGRNIRYSGHQLRFGIRQWEKLVESGFDFSAIGYEMLTNSPVAGLDVVFDAA